MQKEDFIVIDKTYDTLQTLRELTKDEARTHKKVKLIVKQIETQEQASSDLEKIRNELNELNK